MLGGAFGILVLANLGNQQRVRQIFPLVIFPQFFLAGVFNPITRLPPFLFILSRAAPMTYAVDGRQYVAIAAGYSIFAFGLPTLLRFWLKEPPLSGRLKLYMPRMQKDIGEATRFAKSVVENQRLGEFYDVQWV